MLFRYLALLAVTLVLGCSAPTHGRYKVHSVPAEFSFIPDVQPVYIDADFAQDEKQAIHQALADWNLALNGYRQYRVETDTFGMEVSVLKQVANSHEGLVILSLNESQVPEDVGSGALAWVDELYSPIVFVATERVGQRELRVIVAHEIGHTLGLAHVPVMGSLMNPYYNFQSGCIDQLTVQFLAAQPRRMNWDWHHMNYCELEPK